MKNSIVLASVILLQLAACDVNTSGLTDFDAGGRSGQLGRGTSPPLADGGPSPSSTGGSAHGGSAVLPASTGGSQAASGGAAVSTGGTGGSIALPPSTGGSPVSSGGAVVPASSGGSGGSVALPPSTGGSSTASGGAGAPSSSGGAGGSVEQPVIVVMDDGVCSNREDGTSCEGRISGDSDPSSGLHLGGVCRASVCCMGCWDGSTCHYFDNSSCPAGPTGGGECFACDKLETCRVMVQPGRPLPRMTCL